MILPFILSACHSLMSLLPIFLNYFIIFWLWFINWILLSGILRLYIKTFIFFQIMHLLLCTESWLIHIKDAFIIDTRNFSRCSIDRSFLCRSPKRISLFFFIRFIINSSMFFSLDICGTLRLFFFSLLLIILFFLWLRSSLMWRLLFLRSWCIILMRSVTYVFRRKFKWTLLLIFLSLSLLCKLIRK